MTDTPYQYDVCFSFAYEDQVYVDAVAKKVRSMGINIFYSPFVEAELWGENLHDYFSEIYSKKSRYCVMFISKHYADNLWTNLERINAQARAFLESESYILPARFDRTEIPGLPMTVAYINLAKKSPEELADIIFARVRGAASSDLIEPSSSSHKKTSVESRSDKRTMLGLCALVMLAIVFGYWIYKQANSSNLSGSGEVNRVSSVETQSHNETSKDASTTMTAMESDGKTQSIDACNNANPLISCLWKEP